jgi:hypothetical protein
MPRRLALAPLALMTLTAGEPAGAQHLRSYHDWMLGCDNLRACVAIGLEPPGRASGVYLRVVRSGAAGSEPDVRLTAYDERPGPLGLRLAFDGAGGLSLPDIPATARGERGAIEGRVPRALVRPFLEASRQARTLSVSVVAGADAGSPTLVSLAGAAASLLAMDEQQKRVGTAGALVAAGAQPAAQVPPVPPLPVIRAAPGPGSAPPGTMPPPVAAAVARMDCDEPPETRPIRAQLDGRTLLWGVLCTRGAYRDVYAFVTWRAGARTAEPAAFPFPGVGDRGEPGHMLTNPAFDAKTGILAFGDLGRSMGDCGSEGRFAWDGTRFQPLHFKAMPDCRGVAPADWLVTWRTGGNGR